MYKLIGTRIMPNRVEIVNEGIFDKFKDYILKKKRQHDNNKKYEVGKMRYLIWLYNDVQPNESRILKDIQEAKKNLDNIISKVKTINPKDAEKSVKTKDADNALNELAVYYNKQLKTIVNSNFIIKNRNNAFYKDLYDKLSNTVSDDSLDYSQHEDYRSKLWNKYANIIGTKNTEEVYSLPYYLYSKVFDIIYRNHVNFVKNLFDEEETDKYFYSHFEVICDNIVGPSIDGFYDYYQQPEDNSFKDFMAVLF